MTYRVTCTFPPPLQQFAWASSRDATPWLHAAALLDDEEGIPGADNILDTYLGQVLEPNSDEIADFREVETPQFETGTRVLELRNRRPH